MLETRELYKVYKPKKGVAVTALNKVSLKFPEKGMVFLLGKSGSGKSTMLNLLGGLDQYDSGEIIIKGVSSKDFNQKHFDSYRNTYVGFIFQEYNILEEFTVGANIALALELQGRKATDEEINEILKEVDLEGYGNRKPNELSGGQKQRVAIARALVKNPEIIMADEPTGALDSNTGRQVFDTLKKLSKEKLVIVVSHDREFSELYADRIIELSDGTVISDVEVDTEALEQETSGDLQFHGDMVTVAPGYHLTEEDRAAINDYIDRITDNELNLKLTGKSQLAKKFKDTRTEDIKMQDGSSFKLIKSKLPLKSAFKIGASGLKFKKFRLFMTILLSVVSFGLFGLADTFGSYDHIKACTKSLVDSNVDYVSVEKAVRMKDGAFQYYDSYQQYIGEEELENLKKEMKIDINGVFLPINTFLDFSNFMSQTEEMSETDYNIYASSFSGFAEVTQEMLDEYGYELAAGRLPEGGKDEIAVSDYVYESFQKAGYVLYRADSDNQKKESIKNYDDLIGKTLVINKKTYTITGIVDTHFDFDRYAGLMEKKENQSTTDRIVDYALMSEFGYATGSSLAGAAMVGPGTIDTMVENEPNISPITKVWMYLYGNDASIEPEYLCRLRDVQSQNIIWLDGEKKELGENEIIVASNAIMTYEEGDGTIDPADKAQTDKIKNDVYQLNIMHRSNDEDEMLSGYKIVGIIPIDETNENISGTVVVNNKFFNKYIGSGSRGVYSYAVGPMPKDEKHIKELVSYCYRDGEKVQYQLQNAVTYELDTINQVLKTLSKIFFYIGIGFAVFASLMLANFIATSISHKKQEIGVLRAIGSRGNDVFRIFFSESFIIAMINFVLASVGVGIVTNIINMMVRKNLGVLITVLNFGVRQVLLLFAVSVVVAVLASFIPVKKIASKKPIDAIRNR